MTLKQRLRPAATAGAKHLLASVAVALACAALVFGLWYPHPYSELVGGRELFFIVISADVVSGPLLTLVVFDPRKPRRELVRDIGVVVVLQLAALGYGLWSVLEARPVFLAFEGDRFRVVRVPDIDRSELVNAPPELRRLSLTGPKLVAARLAKSTDRDFMQSVRRSLEGDHPSFRPERWEAYAAQRSTVIAKAMPLSKLRQSHPSAKQLVDDAVARTGVSEERLGYLPLLAAAHTDWVVIVGLDDALPRAYLPLDGFL